ncbi:DUF2914 domain-containing protein [Pseudoalteromonas luteoviolacea]|uniref:DUF2914 domain-containing protein n=1 Tax=Pseudoalteromonas luteoviolacea TaxID=43657 RepID=UPI001B371DD1|nr:DUF2914 domain-containing protein [Pseudoalteromonas luteoviolacea]MBQ4838930.1 DUF2914 domain-containing protein [Pseudoalteromonas luteoviolacea]
MTQRIVIKTKMIDATSQPRRVETVGYQYHWRRIFTALCVAGFGVTALSYGVFTSVYADETDTELQLAPNAVVSGDEAEQPILTPVDTSASEQSESLVIPTSLVADTDTPEPEVGMVEPVADEPQASEPEPSNPAPINEPKVSNSQTQFAADAHVASIALNAKVDTSHISRAVLTSGIENREPINVLKHLVEPNKFQEKLFFFTEIKGLQGQVVQHLWFHQDQLMADISLPVSTPRYRTYSSKNIMPSQTGEWRVEVITESGQLLAQKSFRILAKAP